MTETRNPLTIRKGLQSDAETIARFQIAMALETEELALETETVAKGVQRVFDEPVRGQYWLAEHNGETVASLLTLTEWSDWRNGEVIWIHSVYVRPEFRRQGIFRAMYARLKQQVETSPDLKGLRLYVEKTNARAIQVYRALGMSDRHYDMFEWLK